MKKLLILLSLLLSVSMVGCIELTPLPPDTTDTSTETTTSVETETDDTPSDGTEEELQIISIEMIDEYGDSTIIKYGDFEILIDVGDSGDTETVKAALKEYCEDEVLELFIATHAHADHIGGISSDLFFRSAGLSEVETIVDFGYTYTTAAYRRYISARNALITQGTEYYSIKELVDDTSREPIFWIDEEDGVFLEFFDTGNYFAKGASGGGKSLNETSIAFAVSFENVRLLMTGDLTSQVEAELVKNIKAEDPDYFTADHTVIYKSAHHGSNGSNSVTLMNYIKPDYVFISAAIVEKNRTQGGISSNQHPYDGAVARMKAQTANIYWNGINGTTVFSTDGETVTVVGLGRTLNYYISGAVVPAMSEKDITYLDSKWYNR